MGPIGGTIEHIDRGCDRGLVRLIEFDENWRNKLMEVG